MTTPSQTMVHLVREHSGEYEDAYVHVICAVPDKDAADGLVERLADLARAAQPLQQELYAHLDRWLEAHPCPEIDGWEDPKLIAWDQTYNAAREAWLDTRGVVDPDLRDFVIRHTEGEKYSFDVTSVPLRASVRPGLATDKAA